MRRFGLERQMHPLVAAVLFGMPRRDPFQPDAQPQPPDGQLTQPVERVRRRKGHAVVGANRLWQAKVLKRALEDGEGIALLGRRQRFAGNQVATGEIGDRQRVAVPPIREQEFAFVVRAPQHVRRAGLREPRKPPSNRAHCYLPG